MTDYQVGQVQHIGVCLLVVGIFYAYARLVRGKAWPPVLGVGAIFAVGAASTFAISFLAAGLEGWAQLQVTAKLLRELPVACTLSYACLVQARRYRGLREAKRLRAWFERAPYVVGSAYVTSLLLGLISPFPALEINEALPPRALVLDSLLMVPFAVYAGSASLVFLGAVRPEVIDFGKRLQNRSAAVGMGAMSLIAVNTLLADGVRVLGTPERISWWMPKLLAVQNVMIPVEVLGLAGALVCCYARNKPADFTERFLGFVGLIDNLTDVVENAPISKAKLNVQYASLVQATMEGFLDLPEGERRRASDAFRGVAILKCAAQANDSGGELSRDLLLNLAEACREESEAQEVPGGRPRAAKGGSRAVMHFSVAPPALPGASEGGARGRTRIDLGGDACEVLGVILGLVDEAEGRRRRTVLTDTSPEWVQLCCVALADTELFESPWGEDVLGGETVPQRVKDAYSLAKYKVFNHRTSSGDLFEH